MSRLGLILLLLTLLVQSGAAEARWTHKVRYEKEFKRSTKRYLPPGFDHRWFIAQSMAESALNPKAVSPVGAKGYMQFMPGTWGDMEERLWDGRKMNVFDPKLNIRAGVYYMAILRRQWSSKRSEHDRHFLALASYNAGFGNILKAQKKSGGKRTYAGIMECLPQVTGRRARETLQYAPRIEGFYKELLLR